LYSFKRIVGRENALGQFFLEVVSSWSKLHNFNQVKHLRVSFFKGESMMSVKNAFGALDRVPSRRINAEETPPTEAADEEGLKVPLRPFHDAFG
jgi:hypothetical protein